MSRTPQKDVRRYLKTGDSGGIYAAWPGDSFLVRAANGEHTLREALVAAVMKRSSSKATFNHFAALDVETLARQKIGPMVRGLFPAPERAPVLSTLSRSVIFITPVNVELVLRTAPFLKTAWTLANLYLQSQGLSCLSTSAPEIVGFSEGTRCYVSTAYFEREGLFDDFLVHEAAHVFHNCKRSNIGLPKRRHGEWLLPIAYGKRELFAYLCETYSRIVELGRTPQVRCKLLRDVERGAIPSDERVDVRTYLDILHEAVPARNGWNRILEHCTSARDDT